MQKRYHTLENIIFDAIVYLVMAFVLICCLVPFIYMLAVSFSGTKPLINGEVFLWTKDFTLDSYKQIFTYPNFFKAYGNTFLYAVGGTAIALIMTSLMAYPLSKTFLWGNKFFTKMVVVTMFFSGGMIPTYLNMKSLHLTGSLWGLILPFMISVYNLIILKTSFASIPESLIEAARIDGAGFFQQFWYITLPNIKGSLALCALLRTIDTFRLFEKVNVLTGGGPAGTTTTITQFLYTYGIKSLDFGFGSAGAIVMTLLVLILSSFYIKRAMG